MSLLLRKIETIQRVDQLIRMQATGTPKNLAKRLEISQASLFRLIDTMKGLNAPICYDLSVQSYVYAEKTFFKCGFFMQELDQRTLQNVDGGTNFLKLGNLIKF